MISTIVIAWVDLSMIIKKNFLNCKVDLWIILRQLCSKKISSSGNRKYATLL